MARKLVHTIYKSTGDFPETEMFGLMSQMRRASVSVLSNIAEGCGRKSEADSIRFLYMARGSLYELESQLYVACDLEFIKKDQLTTISYRIMKCKKILNGFIKYLKSRNDN